MSMHCFFWLLCMTLGDTTLTLLSDLHYNVSNCSQQMPMINQLGVMSVDSDLLAENLLFTLSFTEAPLYSCRACDASSQYCQTPLATDQVYLANDFLYNFRIIAKTEASSWPLSVVDSVGHFTMTSNNTLEISVTTLLMNTTSSPGNQINFCGQSVNLLALLFITAETPFPRDLLVGARDTSETTPLWCTAERQFFDDIDCRLRPIRMFAFTHTFTDCLYLDRNEVNQTPALIQQSPLYWYDQFLLRNASVPLDLPGGSFLCGDNVSEILYRSNLYQFVCANHRVKNLLILRPWYQLAVAFVTLQLNLRQVGYTNTNWSTLGALSHAVMQAQDLLEMHCLKRDTLLDISDHAPNEKAFYSLLDTLGGFTSRDSYAWDENTTCLPLQDYFAGLSPSQQIQRLSPLWYYEVFSLLLYPSRWMELSVILVICCLCLALPMWLLVLAGALWLRRKLLGYEIFESLLETEDGGNFISI